MFLFLNKNGSTRYYGRTKATIYQGEPKMTFRENLSKMWKNIEYILFPKLDEELGELSDKHKQLVSILELVRIEEFIPSTRFKFGRPQKDRAPIARAMIAKLVFKIPYINQLLNMLKVDHQLRAICGWYSLKELPSQSKFSRAFQEFAKLQLPEKAHQFLIKNVYKDQIVGHVVKDSTPIEAREKPLKKCKKAQKKAKALKRQKKKAGELNRRQIQLKEPNLDKMLEALPKQCDTGRKTSAQGTLKIWNGYKLHAAVDGHCVPLAGIVTSASVHDCEVAIPLATKAHQVANNFYDLMDAAYDHPEIKEHSISLGHIPIIDQCPRNKAEKIEKLAEKARKKILNFKTAEDRRYAERLPVERFNALFKDNFGGRDIRYKGHSKVNCQVMFGVLTAAASMLISLLQQ